MKLYCEDTRREEATSGEGWGFKYTASFTEREMGSFDFKSIRPLHTVSTPVTALYRELEGKLEMIPSGPCPKITKKLKRGQTKMCCSDPKKKMNFSKMYKQKHKRN